MRLKLKQIALAGLLASLGASALATNYYFVQPKSAAMAKVAPFSVALNAYTLPAGVVGVSYNTGAGFDLKTLTTVSGDPVYNSALVSFALTSGTLPAGLVLSAGGVLSGTPTTIAAGSPIQVTATYKSATGVQTYSVMVSLAVNLAGATLPDAV